jgi:hypothetical protein
LHWEAEQGSMPRPSIDESLAAEIRRIHRETHNESAGSLQEALDTVVQLALQQSGIEQRVTSDSSGWFPGKYAGKVFDRIVSDSGTNSSDKFSSSQTGGPNTNFLADRSPEDTAIFKTQLGGDRTITLPKAEAKALGLDAEDILQIYAYELETETTD